MEIRKGCVYLANLDPRMRTEPGKVRPVVVVQTDLLNGIHPSTVVCPLTTKTRRQARFLRVHLAAGEGGVKALSDIMVDQLRAIDNRRLFHRLGVISRRNQARLATSLRILLT